MITLKTLRWDNCFSYGPDNEIDLSQEKLVQVIGTNGVGKSSIPLILEEVLFNKNSKGVKKADIPNRNIGKNYNISLEFTKDADEYKVEVVRTSSAKVKLWKNGEDISSHTATNTYKTVQEILGIDFKTFSQVVYQNTNSSLQFLTATDTNRKKFLIDLLNLDNYVELFEVFKAASKEASEELARAQGKCETIQKWLETNKLSTAEVQPLVEIPTRMEETEEELSNILLEIKNISEKNRKIAQNNNLKEQLRNINIEVAKETLKEITQEVSTDLYQSELGSIKATISSLEKNIKKMETLGDICHTCEQPIESDFKENLISEAQADLTQKKTDYDTISNMLDEARRENARFLKAQSVVKEWEDTFRSIDQTLPSETLNKTELEDQAREMKRAITENENERRKAQKENEKRSGHNAKIEFIKEQTEDMKKDLSEQTAKLSGLEAKVSNLEILKKAFSTNGLVAYKIENLVKELEELTNEYLAELSDGRFTLGFVVSNDKLNVEITDNSNTVDIQSLSSGELARVNTATLLAIRKLMSSISKSKINTLFLDEVINVLDEAGREKLVEVLLKEELNTYLVSHGWTHPLLEKIEIVKENNISRMVVN